MNARAVRDQLEGDVSHGLGSHCLVIHPQKRQALGRTLGLEPGAELSRKIEAALEGAGWYRNLHHPHLNDEWPSWWPSVSESGRGSERLPEVWVQRGWQICKRCWHAQPAFTDHTTIFDHLGNPVDMSGRIGMVYRDTIRACPACIAAFRFHTRESVVSRLRDWFRRFAHKVEMGVGWGHLEPGGIGERAREIETFDYLIENWYLVQHFAGRCAYCGVQSPWAGDHGIPVSRGGHSVAENMIVCCDRCNRLKAAKTVSEFFFYLDRKKRAYPTEGKVTALRAEATYLEVFGNLSRATVAEIVSPVANALAHPRLGRVYRFVPTLWDQVYGGIRASMLRECDLVEIISLFGLTRDMSCQVRRVDNGYVAYVSRASLKVNDRM